MEEVTGQKMDRSALSQGEILEITAILAGTVPGGMNENNAAWQRLYDRAMSDDRTLRAIEAHSAIMAHRFRQDFILSRPALAEHCSDRAPGGRWCECSLIANYKPFFTYPDEPCRCDYNRQVIKEHEEEDRRHGEL